jgi:hypothetical protein
MGFCLKTLATTLLRGKRKEQKYENYRQMSQKIKVTCPFELFSRKKIFPLTVNKYVGTRMYVHITKYLTK